jgi:hypothetical protein
MKQLLWGSVTTGCCGGGPVKARCPGSSFFSRESLINHFIHSYSWDCGESGPDLANFWDVLKVFYLSSWFKVPGFIFILNTFILFFNGTKLFRNHASLRSNFTLDFITKLKIFQVFLLYVLLPVVTVNLAEAGSKNHATAWTFICLEISSPKLISPSSLNQLPTKFQVIDKLCTNSLSE